MSLLRPLVAGVLLLAVSTSALGPPNGTVGTLDFRYPNYIVDPLVSCPFEGYFPHPRDNTWFYRCYNRYGSSFFWRAYFQCPPCTVFSDAQDQCVFRETGTQCLLPAGPCRETFEDCRMVPICPAAHPNRAVLSATEVCSKTTLQCPGQPDKPLCQDGYVFDKTNRQCKVGSANSPCLPYVNPAPKPSTTYVPTPPPTTTTPETTSLSTTTAIALEPRPTDGNGVTDKFVCKLAGFRPSAEGYRTLVCSERQFCDAYGHLLVPIIGCQRYLECDLIRPGVFELAYKQCPTGQFFFYRNMNQCGGQGQAGLYDCHPPSTTTQAPPTTQPPPTTTTTPPTHAPPATQPPPTTSTTTTTQAPPTIQPSPTTTTPQAPPSTQPPPTTATTATTQVPPTTQSPPTTSTTTTTQAPPTTRPPNTTTITQTPPPSPIFSPENCTYHGEILGMMGDEVRNYCHPLCGGRGKFQDLYRYCDSFYQCLKASSIKKIKVNLTSCPRNYIFDTTESTCIRITSSGACITLDSSTTTSTPECIFMGQLMANLDRAAYPELPCNNLTWCSNGSSSGGTQTLCQDFYQCLNSQYSNDLEPQKQNCDNRKQMFNPLTRRCVIPETNVCSRNVASNIGSNPMRQAPAKPQSAQHRPHYTFTQHHAAVSPFRLPHKSTLV